MNETMIWSEFYGSRWTWARSASTFHRSSFHHRFHRRLENCTCRLVSIGVVLMSFEYRLENSLCRLVSFRCRFTRRFACHLASFCVDLMSSGHTTLTHPNSNDTEYHALNSV
jgi:hypothetical protein